MEMTDEIRAQIRAQLTAKPAPSKKPNRQRLSKAGLWVKPFHSEALGVSPDQIEAARENLRAHGITADFDSEGRCIVTSEKQFREVAKASGMWSGAHGFQQKEHDGTRILSGREQAEGQRRIRERLERLARE